MRVFANATVGLVAAVLIGGVGTGIATARELLAQAEGGSIGGAIDLPASAAPALARRPRAKAIRTPASEQPSPRQAAERPKAARRSAGMSFDGTWVVSAAGPCAAAGSGQVVISGRRIIGQNGVGGSVSPSGAVTTLGSLNGMTVISKGQIVGNSASGIYHQSDGCTASWTAIKL